MNECQKNDTFKANSMSFCFLSLCMGLEVSDSLTMSWWDEVLCAESIRENEGIKTKTEKIATWLFIKIENDTWGKNGFLSGELLFAVLLICLGPTLLPEKNYSSLNCSSLSTTEGNFPDRAVHTNHEISTRRSKFSMYFEKLGMVFPRIRFHYSQTERFLVVYC